MEFITVEQFREQPMKVQKVFLDWWECDYGDLYYYNEDPHEYKDVEIIDNNLECDLNGDFDYFKSIGPIPLFTEGQLRKFIEDKTECKNIELIGNVNTCEYDLECYARIYNLSLDKKIESLGDNILQAFWKAACMIAKEGMNE